MGHQYRVELDVIASSGEEGLNRLASGGNRLYVDFDRLEEAASDESLNPHKRDYRSVVDWINKLERQNGHVITPSGGTITWNGLPKGKEDSIRYITRCPVTTSKLLRQGKEVHFPDFLKFSGDALRSGIIEVTGYSKDPKGITPKEVLEEKGLEELYPHQFVIVDDTLVYEVRRSIREKKKGSERYFLDDRIHLQPFKRDDLIKSRLPNLQARNLEQRLAFHQLTSPETEVSFLSGGSGSGKTVIAYGAALHLLLGSNEERSPSYEGIVIFKSNDIIGGNRRRLGFLPGTADEKMANHLKSFKDAHILSGAQSHVSFEDMLVNPREAAIRNGREPQKGKAPNVKIGNFWLPPRRQAIEIEHLQFARGRTFERKLVFVDEAQNYTPFEIKQLIERMGVGSKLFLVGDPEQIDNPQLDEDFNGLVFAADTLSGGPRVSFMELDKNYRSQSAEEMRRIKAPRTL